MNIKRILSKLKNSVGVTMTEIVLYIAILTTIVTGIISISIQLVKMKTKADSLGIVSAEASKFLDKVTQDIRDCDNFEVVDEATLDVTKDGVTRRYYLQNSIIYINAEGIDYEVTSNMAEVTSLVYQDWTSVNSSNLIHLEVQFTRGELYENFQTDIHQR